MSDSFTAIEVDRTPVAMWIRLARPEALNALTATMIDELRTAVRAVAEERPRVFVLGAYGRAFCAGVDLKMVRAETAHDHDPSFLPNLLAAIGSLTTEIEALTLPTIAMVNGVAVAGGLELLLGCDLIVAARSAVFGDGHARFGLIPGGGASQRLPRMIGVGPALRLMYTGNMISADAARELGLVSEVVDA
jgi:enoyl-CoA hydratase